MRLRNIRGSREIVEKNLWVVHNPGEWKGRWKECFGNDCPVRIEIGMGKGRFLRRMARENPGINFVGIEKYSSVLVRALEKQQEEELPNIRFIRMDAELLEAVFGRQEVDRIYLNFSDPWPKERHAKRRLTSGTFLERYDGVLAPEGDIRFKTDNRGLFDFSVEEIRASGWEIRECTCDLQHSGFAKGNIMTEYEEKFSALGHPICYLRACRGNGAEGLEE